VSEPSGWSSQVSKAAWTLLLVAVSAFIVWRVLRPLVPVLLIAVGVLFVYRFACRGFRRDGW
jgi:hypothetical protein